MEVTELPKASGIVRPIADLVPKDRLIYRALVHACIPAIQCAVAWSQNKIDFGHVIRTDASDGIWTRTPYKGWSRFRSESLKRISEGAKYVSLTDIAAYYEQVDLRILLSHMKDIDCPDICIDLLSRCLYRWAVVDGRGLPQGPEASNILAKLYLNVVDQALVDEGITHLRYNDDIRIFAQSEAEAEQQMTFLGRTLRPLGLTLQAAKSQILGSDQAAREIEGVVPVLRQILKRWSDELSDIIDVDSDPYPQVFEIDAAIADNPDNVPVEAIREAFSIYFVQDPRPKFDKTLFHFLLGALGKASDDCALPHAISYMRTHPEETNNIIEYLYRLDAYALISDELTAFLGSSRAVVYPHQAYQVMKWVSRQPVIAGQMIGVARRWAFDRGAYRHLRAICRQVIGRHGTGADRARLVAEYDSIPDPLERAQIICCVGGLEKGRRNSFFGRARTDHDLSRRAVTYVRQSPYI